MGTDADPIVGHWYQYEDSDEKFEVVAVDEDTGTIEIQHFDGDIEELDADHWYELDIEPVEPPEDWTGPIDDIERDDLGYSDDGMQPADWTPSARKKGGKRKPNRVDEDEDDYQDDWDEDNSDEESYGDDEY